MRVQLNLTHDEVFIKFSHNELNKLGITDFTPEYGKIFQVSIGILI